MTSIVKRLENNELCDDCAGYDYEWMNSCAKHKTVFCRGCHCPDCEEDDGSDDDFFMEANNE